MLRMRCCEIARGVIVIDQATRQRMEQFDVGPQVRGAVTLRQAGGEMRLRFARGVSKDWLGSLDGQQCWVAYTAGSNGAELGGEWAILPEREACTLAQCWQRARGLTLVSAWRRVNAGELDWSGMSRQNPRRNEWRRRLAAVTFAFEELRTDHVPGVCSSTDVVLGDMIDEALDAPYGTTLLVLSLMENQGKGGEAWQMMEELAALVCLNQFFGSD